MSSWIAAEGNPELIEKTALNLIKKEIVADGVKRYSFSMFGNI